MKYLHDEVDKTKGIDYIFMEYCNSGNIAEYVTKMEINEKFIWTFIMKILRALAYIHSKNIIHSDIKPDAILCHRDDRKGLNFKLADFGSAYDGNLTKRQEYEAMLYRGNYNTASPEIIKNETFGKPADIWAFGYTIAFVCNKRYLFLDPDVQKINKNRYNNLVRHAKLLKDGFEKYCSDLNLLVEDNV